jgi:hypothetical protein
MSVLTVEANGTTRSDLDHLQGVWTTVAGLREARLLIAGNRFTFEFVDGEVFMGRFDLGSGHMDMHIDEGPPDFAGQLALCIYHLDGGILRWCPSRPGSNRRLNSFPSVDDHRYLSLVFRQARRAARSRHG